MLLFAGFLVVGLLGAAVNNPMAIFATIGVIGLLVLGLLGLAIKIGMPRRTAITSSHIGCTTCGSSREGVSRAPRSVVEVDTSRQADRTHDDGPHSA
jgi:hypothetical protein